MRSASLVNLASGYNRQNVQAAMLARMGARAAAAFINQRPDSVNTTRRDPGCGTAYVAADTTGQAFCNTLPSALINSELATLPDGMSGLLSVLDGTATGISGVYSAEVTGMAPGGSLDAPGHSATTNPVIELTVTATAKVFPFDPVTNGLCAPGAQEAVSQQTVRGVVTLIN